MFLVPLNVLAMMPFTRPFRWAWMVFTYLVPLLPAILFWVGIVSMLRIYSPEHMKSLTEDLEAPDCVWETGRMRVRGIPGGLPFLIGRALPDSWLPLAHRDIEFCHAGSRLADELKPHKL